MKRLLPVLLLFPLILSGCDNFEKKFYNAIDEGQVNAIKNKNDNKFDLAAITSFTWDSVLVIRGNESVPVFSEEIENDLKRPTTDLPVDKDRFYFLQHDKSIIIKELDSRVHQVSQRMTLNYV
jgi:alpha-acetolactate decarboxylase